MVAMYETVNFISFMLIIAGGGGVERVIYTYFHKERSAFHTLSTTFIKKIQASHVRTISAAYEHQPSCLCSRHVTNSNISRREYRRNELWKSNKNQRILSPHGRKRDHHKVHLCALSHFRTQSDGRNSCCGKPAKRTSEIKGLAISLVRSTGFP